MKKRKSPIALTCREIAALADLAALEHHLRGVPYAEVRRMYDARIPLPIRTVSDAGTLWVDKYYVAYQLVGEDVRYVYVSLAHIREEVNGYRAASRERMRSIRLPGDVARELRGAYRQMRKSGRRIWISV